MHVKIDRPLPGLDTLAAHVQALDHCGRRRVRARRLHACARLGHSGRRGRDRAGHRRIRLPPPPQQIK